MKRILYSAIYIIFIIIFLIQGNLILCAEREKENLDIELEKMKSYKLSESNEKKSVSLSDIMKLLYSNNRRYEVKELQFLEDSRMLEVEVNYFGSIHHMREEFDDIMTFTGFQKVKSYQEDNSGLKKLCFSFIIE